jgi:hypothetical protein
MWRALTSPTTIPPPGARLVPLSQLISDNPYSCIVVLPECTTSNGRGILPLSPSILTVGPKTKIFPVNLRYSPADVTTPIPGAYLSFLWDLCSRPTHCIRVRIAEAVYVPNSRASGLDGSNSLGISFDNDINQEAIGVSFSSAETLTNEERESGLNASERKVLNQVADDLARLGRAKRVGLGVHDKTNFVKMWTKTRTVW